jgi:excisionase family DNA binding protein
MTAWEPPVDFDSSEGLLTAPEVARLYRVDTRTVDRWARNRLMPAIRPGGDWRFSRKWVNDDLQNQERHGQ